jgi:hypothetical protein
MDKLEKLRRRLEKGGKDPEVLGAVTKLLEAPENLDLQIDALGCAHLHHWLPNRKRAFWESFEVQGEAWAGRCVTRIFQGKSLPNAACALLNADAFFTLREAFPQSPSLASLWDAGSGSCGIGLARLEDGGFCDYFYVGWNPDEDRPRVERIDFIERIDPPTGVTATRLDSIEGKCGVRNWFWAELPVRHGQHDSTTYPFDSGEDAQHPMGATTSMLDALGLNRGETP